MTLICCLILGMLPKVVFAKNNVFYIRNNYTQGAYLYEEKGVLCYGIPMEGDQSFQWRLINKEGSTIIQNVKTGNCITLQDHRTRDIEGYWGDPVFCQKFEEENDTFYWEVLEGEGQNITSTSKTYQGFGLHMENVTGGKVRSQFIEADQLTWGNMKWDIIPRNEISFQSVTQEGICIQNVSNNQYLTVNEGEITYGIPTGADDSYLWILETKENNVRIKNKLTGDYLKIENESKESNKNDTVTITCTKLVEEDLDFDWHAKIASSVKIQPAAIEYEGYAISVDEENKGFVFCKDSKTLEEESASLIEWNVVAASEVGDVAGVFRLAEGVYNLKNSYYSLYMMEEDGVAVYGNGEVTDKKTQWRIVYQASENKTALRNEATGHYFYITEETGELKGTEQEVYAWNLLRNKNSLYPDAVIFQDSNHQDRYLHMESLSGVIENSNRVQPSWGTPHWIPIPVDSNATTSVKDEFIAPENFIRLQSVVLENNYLYENNAGGFLYGEYQKEDGRSHWKLRKEEKSGAYLIQNRETEHIVMNKGNGTIRVVEKEETLPEGALWDIVKTENGILIHNVFSDRAEYLQPYLNLKKQNGSVQSSLVSVEDQSCWFLIETAPEKGDQVMTEEELSVTLESYFDTNLFILEAEDGNIEGVYQKEYYKDSYYFVKVNTNEYLYFKDGWKLETRVNKDDIIYQWADQSSQGEAMFENEKQKVRAMKLKSDAVYGQESISFTETGQRFTVFMEEQGTYQFKIGNTKSHGNGEVLVNGIKAFELNISKGKTFELKLNKGINTITFPTVADIESLIIKDSLNKEARGATTTFRNVEAEECVTTGIVLEKDRTYHEIQSEASSRSAVVLDGTGQYLKVELKEPASSFVLRYCIPDSTDGNGIDAQLNLYIDGAKNRSIDLTSKYSWSYGIYPWSNEPADGSPHHFFDEVRVTLDQTYPAGTVLKFQKDAACQAAYYIIDFVELEEVAPPQEQPENSLSITDFGAIPNDETDDTKAFLDCLKEAMKQKKEVWIPVGEFLLDSPSKDFDAGDQTEKNRGIVLTQDNVVIRGAGMWHSVLRGEYAAFFIKANNISFYDFSMIGNATARRDAIDPSGIETDYNTKSMKNLTVQNVWIEHYKTGIWTHNLNNLHVVGCRIRNTYADGMNLRRGTSNSIIEQCDVRYTGDDAIAQWSSDYSDMNNKIRYNTVSLPWLANNIALYGGTDIEITNNLLKDTVTNGSGINISTNFNPVPFAGTILIENNTLLRCGSEDHNTKQANGAIWFNTVSGNDNNATVILSSNKIMNSTCQGISFYNNGTVSNVTMENNYIDGCEYAGIEIGNAAKGNLHLKNNVIKNMMLERIVNNSRDQFNITQENTMPLQDFDIPKESRVSQWIILGIVIGLAGMFGVFLNIHNRKCRNNGRKAN